MTNLKGFLQNMLQFAKREGSNDSFKDLTNRGNDKEKTSYTRPQGSS